MHTYENKKKQKQKKNAKRTCVIEDPNLFLNIEHPGNVVIEAIEFDFGL